MISSFLMTYSSNHLWSRRVLLLLVVWLQYDGAQAWELKRFQFQLPQNNAVIPITYYHHSSVTSSSTTKSSPFSIPNLSFLGTKQQPRQLPPLLCIHPVGVGLASWYWNKLVHVAAKTDGSMPTRDIYAINLPGCGIVDLARLCDENEADDYIQSFADTPLEQVPQLWLDACQALMDQVILASNTRRGGPTTTSSCQLLVQGGLAPIGVALAARNPNTISSIVMTSPPTYQDLVTPVPFKDIQFNYDFLKSPLFGTLAFGVLESRWAIQVFSNAFLFQEPCDDDWLDLTLDEACPETRAPIQAFNAGICRAKSFEQELVSLTQPILILQGENDTIERRKGRESYVANMQSTRALLETLPGKSLLPWESPRQTWNAIQEFTARIMQR